MVAVPRLTRPGARAHLPPRNTHSGAISVEAQHALPVDRYNCCMSPAGRFAFRDELSRGRRCPETAHPYRSEFQRDRDRIVHSRAFRRLESKTQVFTRRYSDHFRNRLTHTLEVSQISRTVAQALSLNSELVETLALAHDIGHPPFGHSGEEALDRAMRLHGDSFDHNLHALRIVEEFEVRYAAFPGLNLTFEVREGIIKHSHDYKPGEHLELSEYRLDQRPPLEAQLIDLTDEISYGAADLDDAFEAHLVSIEQLRLGVSLFGRLLEEVRLESPQAPEKLRFNEALRLMIDYFVTDLIRSTALNVEQLPDPGDDHEAAVEAVRAHPHRLVGFSSDVESERRELKAFLLANVYQHPQLHAEKEHAGALVAEMFELYTTHPELLPRSYQAKIAAMPPHRVVCDYLAGMTDNYITQLHLQYGSTKRIYV